MVDDILNCIVAGLLANCFFTITNVDRPSARVFRGPTSFFFLIFFIFSTYGKCCELLDQKNINNLFKNVKIYIIFPLYVWSVYKNGTFDTHQYVLYI